VIVLEEHSVFGGLGSAVTEIAAASAPTWVCRVGVADRFSKFCGSYDYLMREHGLDVDTVVEHVRHFLAKLKAVARSKAA
jgi:transketolase